MAVPRFTSGLVSTHSPVRRIPGGNRLKLKLVALFLPPRHLAGFVAMLYMCSVRIAPGSRAIRKLTRARSLPCSRLHNRNLVVPFPCVVIEPIGAARLSGAQSSGPVLDDGDRANLLFYFWRARYRASYSAARSSARWKRCSSTVPPAVDAPSWLAALGQEKIGAHGTLHSCSRPAVPPGRGALAHFTSREH